jgi:hypothetical protein
LECLDQEKSGDPAFRTRSKYAAQIIVKFQMNRPVYITGGTSSRAFRGPTRRHSGCQRGNNSTKLTHLFKLFLHTYVLVIKYY